MKRITLRVRDSLYEKIKTVAKRNGRSMNSQIAITLSYGLLPQAVILEAEQEITAAAIERAKKLGLLDETPPEDE